MPWLVEQNDLGGIDVWHCDHVPQHPGSVFPDDQEQAALLHALACVEDRQQSLRSSAKTIRTALRRIKRKEQARQIAERARQ